MAAEVEAEPGPDPARSALPLLQVGLGRPHCGVVRHVVVGREQLHLLPARQEHTGTNQSMFIYIACWENPECPLPI